MKDIISQIHQTLIKKQATLALAESCTGGLIASLLTKSAGSSRYFTLAVVTYSNQAKISILKIPAQLIATKGAVSQEVAKAMARSVRNLIKADYAIGVTGIAGPTGGTPQKPVGTVFIAIDNKNKTICGKFRFTGSRNVIRKKAALKSLELLLSVVTQGRP